VLQLHKTDGGHEYAEFLHAPRKRFTDFGKATGLRLFITAIRLFYALLIVRVSDILRCLSACWEGSFQLCSNKIDINCIICVTKIE
jgi:hypothetical protein